MKTCILDLHLCLRALHNESDITKYCMGTVIGQTKIRIKWSCHHYTFLFQKKEKLLHSFLITLKGDLQN